VSAECLNHETEWTSLCARIARGKGSRDVGVGGMLRIWLEADSVRRPRRGILSPSHDKPVRQTTEPICQDATAHVTSLMWHAPARNGADIRCVQDLLGQAQPETAGIYTCVSRRQTGDIGRALDNLELRRDE